MDRQRTGAPAARTRVPAAPPPPAPPVPPAATSRCCAGASDGDRARRSSAAGAPCSAAAATAAARHVGRAARRQRRRRAAAARTASPCSMPPAPTWPAGRPAPGRPRGAPSCPAAGPLGYLAVSRAPRPSDALASAFLQQLKDSLLLIVGASIALSAARGDAAGGAFPAADRAPRRRRARTGRGPLRRAPAGRSAATNWANWRTASTSWPQKLEAAEDSRRQWVADTSHELRTPLSVLRAQLEAIQDGVRPAGADSDGGDAAPGAVAQQADRRAVCAGARRCRRPRLPQDAARPVARWHCEQAAAFERQVGRRRPALRRPARRPPRALVMADPERMRQVFANLFENCVRYTHARRDGVACMRAHDGATLAICARRQRAGGARRSAGAAGPALLPGRRFAQPRARAAPASGWRCAAASSRRMAARWRSRIRRWAACACALSLPMVPA